MEPDDIFEYAQIYVVSFSFIYLGAIDHSDNFGFPCSSSLSSDCWVDGKLPAAMSRAVVFGRVVTCCLYSCRTVWMAYKTTLTWSYDKGDVYLIIRKYIFDLSTIFVTVLKYLSQWGLVTIFLLFPYLSSSDNKCIYEKKPETASLPYQLSRHHGWSCNGKTCHSCLQSVHLVPTEVYFVMIWWMTKRDRVTTLYLHTVLSSIIPSWSFLSLRSSP